MRTPEDAVPLAREEPVFVAASSLIEGIATRYGTHYNGQVMGCGGTYSSRDPTIIAVGGSRDGQWPCGTPIQVCGPSGCTVTVRQDSCPGCGAYHIDLSEAGMAVVCGEVVDICHVRFQAMQVLTR